VTPRSALGVSGVPVRPERKPLSDDLGVTYTATLSVRSATTTAEQAAADEAAQADGRMRMAHGVARYSMRDSHGCTGTGCREAAHDADRVVRDELLDELGVDGERERAAVRAAARRGAG
jgi:hypothetical protein